MNKERGRKTGGSAPTEFFGGITDLYFTPDLPSDVYVFNILDAQTARACAHRCTDASLSTNVQRCTNSHPLPPPLSIHPPFSPVTRPLVHPSLPLISTQIRDLLFPLLFFSRFFPPPSFISFPPCLCFSSRASSTSPHLFREIPPFLACSLHDPLKSFSLCISRNSFS